MSRTPRTPRPVLVYDYSPEREIPDSQPSRDSSSQSLPGGTVNPGTPDTLLVRFLISRGIPIPNTPDPSEEEDSGDDEAEEGEAGDDEAGDDEVKNNETEGKDEEDEAENTEIDGGDAYKERSEEL